MAVAIIHVGVAEDSYAATPVDAAHLDDHILGLTAVRTAIHAQRTADGSGDAAQKRKPRDCRLLRHAADLHVRHRGADANAAVGLDLHVSKTAAESDHDTRHTA